MDLAGAPWLCIALGPAAADITFTTPAGHLYQYTAPLPLIFVLRQRGVVLYPESSLRYARPLYTSLSRQRHR